VTRASPVIATPLVASEARIARQRTRILLALICGYFFIAFAAPILTDEAGLLLLKPHHWWNGFDRNWLCGCVTLIAGSMALGSGPLPKRLVQGFIGLGWLFLIWLLGLTMSPNWKPEIELTWLVCAAVAVTTFAVLIIIRRFSGKMIVRADTVNEMGTKRFQYTLTTLLLVMFLLCMTFALMGWIDPRYRHYFDDPNVQLRWYVSWHRREVLGRIGSDALTAILIAGACCPAFLSRRKQAFAWAIGLSVIALAITTLKDEFIRVRILIPLVQGKPVDWWDIDYALIPCGVNWATLVLCLLIAATAMHWLGYQISKT